MGPSPPPPLMALNCRQVAPVGGDPTARGHVPIFRDWRARAQAGIQAEVRHFAMVTPCWPPGLGSRRASPPPLPELLKGKLGVPVAAGPCQLWAL